MFPKGQAQQSLVSGTLISVQPRCFFFFLPVLVHAYFYTSLSLSLSRTDFRGHVDLATGTHAAHDPRCTVVTPALPLERLASVHAHRGKLTGVAATAAVGKREDYENKHVWAEA